MTPDEDMEKAVKAEIKFRAFVACCWGLVVLFAMMGVILGKPAAIYIGVIAAVMWVLNRIIREAFDGLRMLRGIKAADAVDKKDGGPPPGPFAST